MNYAELRKVISDIGNNVPATKVFGELICEDIIDKCC